MEECKGSNLNLTIKDMLSWIGLGKVSTLFLSTILYRSIEKHVNH